MRAYLGKKKTEGSIVLEKKFSLIFSSFWTHIGTKSNVIFLTLYLVLFSFQIWNLKSQILVF